MGEMITPASGQANDRFVDPSDAAERVAACVRACRGRLRTAIDGGAYVGTWSVQLLPLFRRVIAFEPIAENAECLALNCPGAEIHRAALGAEAGSVSMARQNERKAYSYQRADHGVEVPVMAVDDLRLEDLDLVKLDLEGMEHDALRGARETLLRCRPVVMVEEKFDPDRLATRFLVDLGMVRRARFKRDWLFSWGR